MQPFLFENARKFAGKNEVSWPLPADNYLMVHVYPTFGYIKMHFKCHNSLPKIRSYTHPNYMHLQKKN